MILMDLIYCLFPYYWIDCSSIVVIYLCIELFHLVVICCFRHVAFMLPIGSTLLSTSSELVGDTAGMVEDSSPRQCFF